MELPRGDGVLSKESRGAYRLIVFVVGWFVAGIATTVAIFTLMGQPAHASVASAGVEAQLKTLVEDTSEIKRDLAVVKCLLHVGGICPSR